MNISNIVNVVDIEHNNYKLIEIGLTEVNTQTLTIGKSICIPIKVDFEISPEIRELTGWTTSKLNKRGVSKGEAIRLLYKYGGKNRAFIADMPNEVLFIEQSLFIDGYNPSRLSLERLNISFLFKLITGRYEEVTIDSMLEYFGLTFEGRKHLGVDDSKNIARIFIELLKVMRNG